MPDTAKHVALVVSLNKRFDRKVIEGITRFVNETGKWSVFLEDDPQVKIPDFTRGHFDGVLADLDDPRIPERVAELDIPVVGIGEIDPSHPLRMSTVGTDNRKIGIMAADYLVQLGASSFGFCGLPERTIDPWQRVRKKAFTERLREAGHKCSLFSSRISTSHSWESLQEKLYAWLEPLPKPVGIFAANDVRARHVLEACRHFGLRVPDDVAVLGVDNDDLICQLAFPPLSSIVQDTETIGYEAAALLDRMMRRKTMKPEAMLIKPVAVVERLSTDLVYTTDPIVAEAMAFIRDNACQGIGVSQVADGVGVSRSSLDGHFKQALGRTVHYEILRVQLNFVKNLLANTTLPQETIARRAGFSNAQYLAALFRRVCHQTPGEYRRRTG